MAGAKEIPVREWVSSFEAISEISDAAPGDIQKIAASQIKLLNSYYNAVLAQAKMSFNWALVAAGIGLAFFVSSVAFLLLNDSTTLATIGIISGSVIEVIAGINFALYGKTTNQLASFHQRLDQTQRFLLANSICESMEGQERQKARAELVRTISLPHINGADYRLSAITNHSGNE